MTSTVEAQRNTRFCRTCGEPELTGLVDSGEFGWQMDNEFKLFCVRCGSNPLRRARRPKVTK